VRFSMTARCCALRLALATRTVEIDRTRLIATWKVLRPGVPSPVNKYKPWLLLPR